MRINHRSDFDFFIRLFDCDGKPVGMPRDIELDMQLITGWLDELDAEEWCPKLAGFSQGAYTAKYRKDVTENCMVEGGKLRVIVDNHNLTPGALTIEMTLKLPRTIYPDGDQRIVAKKKTCIELITGRGDAWTDSPTIDFYLPVSLPQADQSAVMTQPLPFRFGVVGDKPAPGHPVFDREYGRFFRPVKDHNAEAIDPAEGPYNIYAADGRIIANTDRLFICGRTVYRYTGRELVNVAIEQNPNQRLVCKTPSVNAHPGLVYLDRGFIRLPIHRGLNRVPINDLYFKLESGGIVPLEKVVGIINIGDPDDGTNIPAEIVDGHVVFSVGNYVVSHRLRAWVEISELRGTNDGSVNNSYIAVRYDAFGRKIFYRVDRLPRHEMDAPTIGEALSVIESGNASDDSDQCFVACHNSWYQLEVWYRRRHGKGRISENKNGKLRHMHHDRQWRWRKGEEHFLNCHYCLLRIRRATGKNRSKWTYIHFNVKKHEMRLATQVRT